MESQYSADYIQVQTTVPVQSFSSGGLFGNFPIGAGGTITFGNQAVAGSMWMWGLLALAVVYLLARK